MERKLQTILLTRHDMTGRGLRDYMPELKGARIVTARDQRSTEGLSFKAAYIFRDGDVSEEMDQHAEALRRTAMKTGAPIYTIQERVVLDVIEGYERNR